MHLKTIVPRESQSIKFQSKSQRAFWNSQYGIFSPEDLNIIKNGPAERRRFLDSELCQLDKIYLSDLTTYNKILNQRNKLLKDMVYRPDLKDTLPVWDMQLVETGRKIIRRRKQFVDELNEIVHDIHYRISGEKEDLLLQYEPSIEDIFFEDELSRVKERDMRQCMTSVGPHRDDLLFPSVRWTFGSSVRRDSRELQLCL